MANRLDRVLDNHINLVYSAHTSVGKCFLAEILILKTVTERKLKSIIIVPDLFYIQELQVHLQYMLGPEYTIISLTNPHSYFMQHKLKIFDVIICDLDSATIIINKLIESQILSQIGSIVFDGNYFNEFQHAPAQNFQLQCILIKLLYFSKIHPEPKIQLIGMCSTVCNMEAIANWISAAFYTTNFRNISIYQQYSTADGTIYDNQWNQLRKIERRVEFSDGKGHAIQLCLETMLLSGTVIIYCCGEDLNMFVQELTSAFEQIMSSAGGRLKKHLERRIKNHELHKLKEELACDNMDCLQYGIGVYQPDLSNQQRYLLEQAFNENVLRVLVGNRQMAFRARIMARRVIIRGPLKLPSKFICYQQMIQTAGRNGCDFGAEIIYIDTFNSSVTNEGKNLLSARIAIKLQQPFLFDRHKYFQQFILEAITYGLANNNKDICSLCSFGNHDQDDFNETALQHQINSLNNFFKLDDSGKYVPTPLGKACAASLILPQDALEIIPKLKAISDCKNELLWINFLLIFFKPCPWVKPDWTHFLNVWEHLCDDDRNVGILIGIDENTLKLMPKRMDDITKRLLNFEPYTKFYVALMIRELMDEQSLKIVAGKYYCDEDSLQILQQQVAEYAFKITEFCAISGVARLSISFSQFRYRLYYGAKPELVEMLEHNKWMDVVLARALFEAGIKTPPQLATINVTVLKIILHNLKLKQPNWMDSMNTNQIVNYLVSQARKNLEMISGVVCNNKEIIGHPRFKSTERNLMMNANRFGQTIVKCEDLYVSLAWLLRRQ